jgi:ribosomal protein S18 acetylase RimI-like enzyme
LACGAAVGHAPGVIALCVLGPDDWPIWRRLRLTALAEAPYAFGSRLADWQGDGDQEDRWRSRLAIPGSYHTVAELDGEPVGMAGGIPTGADGVVELVSMWVAPSVRGNGVAGLLIQEVERWARAVPAKELRLAVAEGNQAAASLYQRHGFRHTGEIEVMPDGVRLEHIMSKPIDRGWPPRRTPELNWRRASRGHPRP